MCLSPSVAQMEDRSQAAPGPKQKGPLHGSLLFWGDLVNPAKPGPPTHPPAPRAAAAPPRGLAGLSAGVSEWKVLLRGKTLEESIQTSWPPTDSPARLASIILQVIHGNKHLLVAQPL